MIQLLEDSQENLIKLKVVGSLDRKDYEQVIPYLNEQIEKHGKLNLYLEAEDLDGITAKALWQDFKFDVKHRDDFLKIAVVGDQEWLEWLTRIAAYFITGKTRFFKTESKMQALQWLREK